MNDIEYELKKEIREKKNIGHSYKNMNRTGKGPLRFPSDYLTKKEKKKLNGPVASYDMGKPMSYAAFNKMPSEMQKLYLDGIIEKFHPTTKTIAELFGINPGSVSYRMKKLGVKPATPAGVSNKIFDEKAWDAWISDGKIPETAAPETTEVMIQKEISVEKPEPVEDYVVPTIPTDISFRTVAFMWSSYLSNRPAPLKPEDAAAMLAILQMVAISSGKATKEDWENLSRYALFASKIV